MLILGRKEGEWITVVHDASGDTLRIRLFNVQPRTGRRAAGCLLGFDDSNWRFWIDRPRSKNALDRAGTLDHDLTRTIDESLSSHPTEPLKPVG